MRRTIPVAVESNRATAAATAASAVSAATALFGQAMLIVGGIGGTVGAFVESGFVGAILFLMVWGLIGATIWGVGLGVLTIVLAGTTYGIVWIVYPDGWAPWLRWLMVVPAAVVGFVLVTLLNVVFRVVEAFFPLNGVTAIGSLFFVSTVQTMVAVIAAGWIAPTSKHTVRVVCCTVFCLLATGLFLVLFGSNASNDVPRWASLTAIALSAFGAILATTRNGSNKT